MLPLVGVFFKIVFGERSGNTQVLRDQANTFVDVLIQSLSDAMCELSLKYHRFSVSAVDFLVGRVVLTASEI
jgi:hypothetical protein